MCTGICHCKVRLASTYHMLLAKITYSYRWPLQAFSTDLQGSSGTQQPLVSLVKASDADMRMVGNLWICLHMCIAIEDLSREILPHTKSANACHIQTSIRPLLSMCTLVTIVWSLPAASWALAIIVCSARPSMTCSVSAWTADQQPASASVCIPVLCILQLAFVLVQLAAECSMTSCSMINS